MKYTIDELLDIGDRVDYVDACMAGAIPSGIVVAISDAKRMRSRLAAEYSTTIVESKMVERMNERQFYEYMREGKPTHDQIMGWMRDHPVGCMEFMEEQ